KGESSSFKTVSLLVKPDHARELVVAAQMGKIMLTLRRPDEKDSEAGEEVTPLAEILSGKSKQASESVAGSSNPTPSFLDTIKGSAGGQPGSAGGPNGTAAPAAAETVWRMVV